MTIINPNSISGISSITALNSTAAINLFKADGTSANIIAGVVTATTFSGNLTGTVNTAAQTNITSLGTLSGLDVAGDVSIIDTATDSAAGPEFKLFRNSASPADADYLGQIKFAGESDTGVERNYAKITGKILDASNGTEDGILEFAHIKAGSQVITGRWRSDSLQLLNSTNFSVAGTSEFTGAVTANDKVRIANTNFNAASNADELILGTTSGNRGITIVSGNTGIGALFFADDGQTNIGSLVYEHNTNQMRMVVNGAQVMRLDNTSMPTWIYGTDTNTYTSLPAADTIAFTTGGTERLRIDSTGRLLVNTTTGFAGDNTMIIAGQSPSGGTYDLYDGQLLITSTETSGAVNTGGVIQFYGHDGGSSRGFGSIRCLKENGTSGNHNAYMAFLLRVNSGNPTERLRIKSDGKVLIGGTLGLGGATSNPSGLLHAQTSSGEAEVKILGATNGVIQLSGYAGNSTINFGDSSSDTPGRLQYNHGNDSFHIRTGSNNRLHIMGNGDYGFNDSSPTANASGNDTVLSIKGKGSSYSGKIDFKDSSGNIDSSIASDNSIFMLNCDPNSQNGNTSMMFSVHGGERFRFGRHGQIGIAGANYGTARQVIVSNGSSSAVSWSSNPFLLDMDSLGDIDYDGVFLRYREVNVSGNGLVYLGLCKSTTNCPAGRIGCPVGFIPGVVYNSQFRVDKVGITPWPDTSGHRYEYFAIISDYVAAGKLGIFYLTNSTS